MVNVSYQVTGVITLAGVSAAIEAGTTGPQIDVAGFRIGSLSAADGSVALETDTDVDGYVYSGDTSVMTYSQINVDTIVWRIRLDPSIGNFEVGNIGIILDGGTLFCKAVLPNPSPKYSSNPPQVVGNTKFYNIVMQLANAAGLINLTILEADNASLPEVPTENDLPPANSTPFNAYLVDNHTHIGEPVVAVRNNGAWLFAPHHVWPNQGVNVIAVAMSMFDSTATVGSACYLSTSNGTFLPADGASITKQGIGVRTSPYEITMSGMVSAAAAGLTTPLAPGTIYYVGTGPNVGKLTTVTNGNPVAFAANTTDVFVSMANGFGSNINFTQENIGYEIDGDGLAPGLVPGSVVYLDLTAGRVWRAADPANVQDITTYNAQRPTGVLDSTMLRVVFFGIVVINSTTAWPLPLNVGSLYFCNTGVNAGNITSNGPTTRWIIGTAIDIHTLLVDMLALASDADHLAPNPTHVKAATPGGVATMINYAISRLPKFPAIPGAIAPITFDGSNYGCIQGSYVVQGSGRVATQDEVNAGASVTTYLYPWVTPLTLAGWKPRVCADGVTIGGDGTPWNPLHVIYPPATITIQPPTLPNGTVGIAYSCQLTASGGVAPYTWSIIAGALAAGLALNASTGLISGIPTAASTGGGTPVTVVSVVYFDITFIQQCRVTIHLVGHGFHIGQEFTIFGSHVSQFNAGNGMGAYDNCFDGDWVVETVLDVDHITCIIPLIQFPVGFGNCAATTCGLCTGIGGGSHGTVTVQAHDSQALAGSIVYPWTICPAAYTVHTCHWDWDHDDDDHRHCGYFDCSDDRHSCSLGYSDYELGSCDQPYVRGCKLYGCHFDITGKFYIIIKGIGGEPPYRNHFTSCQYVGFDGSNNTVYSSTCDKWCTNGDMAFWIWDTGRCVYLPESGSGDLHFL